MIHGRSRVRSTWRYIAIDETLKPSRRSHVNLPSTAQPHALRYDVSRDRHLSKSRPPPIRSSLGSESLSFRRSSRRRSLQRAIFRADIARVAGIVSRASQSSAAAIGMRVMFN